MASPGTGQPWQPFLSRPHPALLAPRPTGPHTGQLCRRGGDLRSVALDEDCTCRAGTGGTGCPGGFASPAGEAQCPAQPGDLGSHAPGGSELSVHCPLNLAGGEGSRGLVDVRTSRRPGLVRLWTPLRHVQDTICSRLGPWIPADRRKVESSREPDPPSPCPRVLPAHSQPTHIWEALGGGPRPHKLTGAHPQSAVQDPPCCARRPLHPPQVLRGLLSAHGPPPGGPPGPSAPQQKPTPPDGCLGCQC